MSAVHRSYMDIQVETNPSGQGTCAPRSPAVVDGWRAPWKEVTGPCCARANTLARY